MSDKLSDAALDTIFRTARSYNGYTDQPVSETEIHAIWDLLKWGPTSANQLPARFVWCTSAEAKERLANCVSATNAPKVRQAPVTVIIGMDENFHEYLPEFFPHTDAKSWFVHSVEARRVSAMRNSSLQGAYLIIAARALGLDVGPMSGFDHAKVDAAFFAETPGVTANFIATIGHGDPASIFGRLPRPEFERFNQLV